MGEYCCKNCFSDYAIKDFIESNDNVGTCDYCGSENIHICSVTEVGEFIMEGIDRYYEDAANSVSYESAEGGYLLPTKDIYEILNYEEEIFGDALDDPTSLLHDLVSSDGTPYVKKDPYGPLPGDPEEIGYWDDFCETVKRKDRFTTFLKPGRSSQRDPSKPSTFLFGLAKTFLPELIHILPPGTLIYRGRIGKEGQTFEHCEITSPPPEYSKNNRMSPAGISFFYGGLDPETCIHELRPDVNEIIIVGTFELIQPLFVLDLSEKFNKWKSIFDPGYSRYYEEFYKPFLRHFIGDISKPIRRTDNELEYVPAQIFTEFIKKINFRRQYLNLDENGKPTDVFLDGIMFRSSLKEGGINIVFFRGPDISAAGREDKNQPWLLYKGSGICKAFRGGRKSASGLYLNMDM